MGIVLHCSITRLQSTKRTITKEMHMTVLSNIRVAVQKHAAYIRTRNEIAAMPQDVAIDLGLFREDADKIAWRAVYG